MSSYKVYCGKRACAFGKRKGLGATRAAAMVSAQEAQGTPFCEYLESLQQPWQAPGRC